MQPLTPRRPRPAFSLFSLPPFPCHTPTCTYAGPTRHVVRLPRPLGVSLAENRAARVVIAAVAPDGPANGLVHVGDVVVGLENAPATSLSGVVDAIKKAPHPHVTLELERQERRSRLAEDDAKDGDLAERQEGEKGFYARQEARLGELLATWAEVRGSGGEREKAVRADLLEEGREVVKSRAGVTSARAAQLILAVVFRLRRAQVPLDVKFWNVVMWSLVQAGAPAKAVEVFEEIDQPNVECFTTLVKSYGKLRKPDDAIELLSVMRNKAVKPNIWTYNALIASCVRGGKLGKARQLFSEMLVDGINPNVVSWNIIINWHVQQKTGAGRLRDALGAFADMKASGVSPNIVTFTTLMKAYTKSGLLNKAEEVFAEIKIRLPSQLDTNVYNTLMRAYASKLDWRRCLELLDEMHGVGVTDETWGFGGVWQRQGPGAVTDSVPRHSNSFSSRRPWLSEQRDGSDDIVARSSLRESPAVAKKRLLIPDNESRCQPDSMTYSLTVKACASAGRQELARDIFDEMMDEGHFPPPAPAVVSLISGYAKAGMLTEAFEVLKNLKSWGVFPDERMLSSIMHGCLVTRQPYLALSVYKKFKSVKYESDNVMHTLLLKAYGMSGQLNKAFDLLKDMRQSSSKQRANIVTYNVMIECALMHKRRDLALKALDLLLVDKVTRSKIDRNTFHALVSIVTAGGSSLSPLGFDASFLPGGDGYAPLFDAWNSQSAPSAVVSNSTEAKTNLQYLMDVLLRFREKRITPTGTLYHALLLLCEACDEWRLGSNLLEERKKGGFIVGRKDRNKEVRILEDTLRARSVTQPSK